MDSSQISIEHKKKKAVLNNKKVLANNNKKNDGENSGENSTEKSGGSKRSNVEPVRTSKRIKEAAIRNKDKKIYEDFIVGDMNEIEEYYEAVKPARNSKNKKQTSSSTSVKGDNNITVTDASETNAEVSIPQKSTMTVLNQNEKTFDLKTVQSWCFCEVPHGPDEPHTITNVDISDTHLDTGRSNQNHPHQTKDHYQQVYIIDPGSSQATSTSNNKKKVVHHSQEENVIVQIPQPNDVALMTDLDESGNTDIVEVSLSSNNIQNIRQVITSNPNNTASIENHHSQQILVTNNPHIIQMSSGEASSHNQSNANIPIPIASQTLSAASLPASHDDVTLKNESVPSISYTSGQCVHSALPIYNFIIKVIK